MKCYNFISRLLYIICMAALVFTSRQKKRKEDAPVKVHYMALHESRGGQERKDEATNNKCWKWE